MDILGASPTSQLLDQAVAGADEAKVRRLGELGPGMETREGLEKTAQEFEAVFMNTLMKAMRKTVPDNKLYNSSGATKFYRQMHDAEIAKAMATGKSGLGIADLIIQQFERNVAFADPAVTSVQKSGQDLGRLPMPPAVESYGPPAPPMVTAPQLVPQLVPQSVTRSQVMERYHSMSPVGEQVAEMARLRGLAEAQGAAVADTLQRFEFEIGSAGMKSGLDPSLILAVVMEESAGNPDARSPKGAMGLMQLMPGTAAEMGVSDATSPAQNLQGGANYLAKMLRKYDGELDLALAAYNAGPGNVDKAGRQIPNFKETQNYVRRVMDRYEGLGGGTNLANGQ